MEEIQLRLESILGAVCAQDAVGFKSICQRGEELVRRILWQKVGCKFQDKRIVDIFKLRLEDAEFVVTI